MLVRTAKSILVYFLNRNKGVLLKIIQVLNYLVLYSSSCIILVFMVIRSEDCHFENLISKYPIRLILSWFHRHDLLLKTQYCRHELLYRFTLFRTLFAISGFMTPSCPVGQKTIVETMEFPRGKFASGVSPMVKTMHSR